MSNASKDKKEISRRDFLKHGAAGAVALPFALVIPSNALNVVTEIERLRSFKEREAAWRKKLENRLSQGPKPLPPGTRNPPPPPREPVPYNTTSDTSQNTVEETSTSSGDPPKADDSDSDTHYDGSKEDWKTDYH